MIVLGVILLVVAWLVPTVPHLVVQLAVVLIVIGAILELFGALGHPLAGRRHYW